MQGRKGFKDEKRLSLLFSTAFNKVIWALTASDEVVSQEIKLELASKVLIKMLPQDIKGENIGTTIINLIRNDRAVREEQDALVRPGQIHPKQV